MSSFCHSDWCFLLSGFIVTAHGEDEQSDGAVNKYFWWLCLVLASRLSSHTKATHTSDVCGVSRCSQSRPLYPPQIGLGSARLGHKSCPTNEEKRNVVLCAHVPFVVLWIPFAFCYGMAVVRISPALLMLLCFSVGLVKQSRDLLTCLYRIPLVCFFLFLP